MGWKKNVEKELQCLVSNLNELHKRLGIYPTGSIEHYFQEINKEYEKDKEKIRKEEEIVDIMKSYLDDIKWRMTMLEEKHNTVCDMITEFIRLNNGKL